MEHGTEAFQYNLVFETIPVTTNKLTTFIPTKNEDCKVMTMLFRHIQTANFKT